MQNISRFQWRRQGPPDVGARCEPIFGGTKFSFPKNVVPNHFFFHGYVCILDSLIFLWAKNKNWDIFLKAGALGQVRGMCTWWQLEALLGWHRARALLSFGGLGVFCFACFHTHWRYVWNCMDGCDLDGWSCLCRKKECRILSITAEFFKITRAKKAHFRVLQHASSPEFEKLAAFQALVGWVGMVKNHLPAVFGTSEVPKKWIDPGLCGNLPMKEQLTAVFSVLWEFQLAVLPTWFLKSLGKRIMGIWTISQKVRWVPPS